jgi:hypothetical protein
MPLVRKSGEWKPYLSEEASLILHDLRACARKPTGKNGVFFMAYSWAGEWDPESELNSVSNIQSVGAAELMTREKVPFHYIRELLDGRHIVKRVTRGRNEFEFFVAD